MINEKDLPDGWNSVKLEDLFDIKKGKKVNFVENLENNDNNAIPYIFIENLRGAPISQYSLDKNGLLCEKEDILLVWDGANCGTVGAGLTGYVGSTIARLRIVDKSADKDYVFRFLKSKFEYFNSNTTGATIPHLDKKNVLSLKIPLPPLPPQKKIAAVLEKAEKLREWRKEADGLTDRFLKSTFLEMFGDPVENPKGWEMRKIGEIGEVGSGLTLNGQRSANRNNLFPYLRVANVFRNKLDLTEIKYIHVSDPEIDKFLLKKNDILIVEGHGNIKEIGRAAVWRGEIPICFHQNHLIRVRLDDKYMDPYFLSYFLNGYGNHGYFSSESRTTSGLNTISTNKVRVAKVSLPHISRQQKFASIVQQVEQIRQHQKESKQKIDDFFNVLMQKAFNGELEA